MRNIFFVLVSLLFGLSYGFIITAGVSKGPSTSEVPVETSTENNLENYDSINQSELYKNVINKTSNLTERSFIYLQQKLRPKYKNQLFKQLLPGLIQPLKTFKAGMVDKMPILFMKARQDFVGPDMRPQLFVAHLEHQRQHNDLDRYSNNRAKVRMLQNQNTNQRVTVVPVESKKVQKEFNNKAHILNVNKPIRYYFSGNNPIVAQINDDYNTNVHTTSYTQRLPSSHNQSCGYLKTNQLYRIRTHSNKKNNLKYNPIGIYNDLGAGPFSHEVDNYERYIKEILRENDIEEDEMKEENFDDCSFTNKRDDSENHQLKQTVYETAAMEEAINTLTSLSSEK